MIAAALLTACSSTSSKPAVCTDAANLKTSVQDLKNVNVRQNGISAVSDQLSKIKQEFSTLKTDAKGQYSTQIDDLSTGPVQPDLKRQHGQGQRERRDADCGGLRGRVGSFRGEQPGHGRVEHVLTTSRVAYSCISGDA